MNKSNKIIFGCLGSLIIFIILSWFALNWLKSKTINFIAETSHEVLNEGIQQSQLPQNQKDAILTIADKLLQAVSSGEIDFNFDGTFKDPEAATLAIADASKEAFSFIDQDKGEQDLFNQQIDRLRQNFLSNELTAEEATLMFEKLADGPFGLSFTAWAIHSHYVIPSSLSVEEKEKAKQTVSTLINGLNEQLIKQSDIENIIAPYKVKNSDGHKSLKNNLTDKEIREILIQLNKLIAENELKTPETSFSITHELQKAFDDAGLAPLK